eukprot:scaffold30472_cov65-Phaeocystis_antarctica.AAC.2
MQNACPARAPFEPRDEAPPPSLRSGSSPWRTATFTSPRVLEPFLVSRLGNSPHIIEHAITTTSRGGGGGGGDTTTPLTSIKQRALRELHLQPPRHLAHVPSWYCEWGEERVPILA